MTTTDTANKHRDLDFMTDPNTEPSRYAIESVIHRLFAVACDKTIVKFLVCRNCDTVNTCLLFQTAKFWGDN